MSCSDRILRHHHYYVPGPEEDTNHYIMEKQIKRLWELEVAHTTGSVALFVVGCSHKYQEHGYKVSC
jgi:hypothetical protein